MDDRDIVGLFFKRDEKGIKEISSKYGRSLRRMAHSLTADRQVSEECENDTYLTAWNRIPPDDPASYLFAYLARILRSKAIDRYRKMSRRKTELFDEIEECIASREDVERDTLYSDVSRTINIFLKSADERDRNIFIRRYFYFDSIASISFRYGCTVSNTKSILYRMRMKLKQMLESEGCL